MKKGNRLLQVAALGLVLALVAAACSTTKTTPSTSKKGGTLRMQTDGFEWNAALDPTAEYLGFSWDIYGGMLLRTLMGYNHKRGSEGGNDPVPDLAAGSPTVSSDGLTYTFKIKKGVKFSPPVNRAVTSKDIEYAFERISNDTLSAGGYANYYDDVIQGFKQGVKFPIPGIQTPDDSTIVFKLSKPTGDFLYRVSLPATAPIPKEVASCFTQNGVYGQYLVSTGPYEMVGAKTQGDPTKGCSALTKLSGFDPNHFLKLERNPNYDPATDSTDQREANFDAFDLELNSNTSDIYNKIENNQVDAEEATEPNDVIAKYQTTPTLKPMMHADPGDRTWYVTMNVTKAPFDDVHVRRAVNFILDRAAMLNARGGSFVGVVAEHAVPPTVLHNLLQPGEFDPFATPGHHGDLAKAEAEMKLSKYDHNHDGICDDPVCKNVLHVTRATPPYPDLAAIEEADLAKIGIKLVTHQVAKFYAAVQTPSQTPPIASGTGWGKDYADASTFFVPLLASGAIGGFNLPLLGLTAAQAKQFKVTLPPGGVPSIDPDIDVCQAKSGDDRNTCWANLDKHFTSDIAAWVPYDWANNTSTVSAAVQNYEYDQFSGDISFAHISIDTSKQVAG